MVVFVKLTYGPTLSIAVTVESDEVETFKNERVLSSVLCFLYDKVSSPTFSYYTGKVGEDSFSGS